MARKPSEKSVSLFPFLAVLVCTMGALILLLLLTTRRIQKQQNFQSSSVVAELPLDVDAIEDAFELVPSEDVPQSVSDSDSTPLTEDDERPTETPPQLALAVPDESDFGELDFPDFDLAEPELPEPTEFELKVEIDRLNSVLEADKQRHADSLDEIAAVERKLAASDFDVDLESEAAKLSNLKQQESVLRAQLSAQEITITTLENKLDRTSRTTDEAERILRVRESALVSLRKLADDASTRSEAGFAKTLLEFTNATGTSQQPIVIEVAEEGFRFSPTNVLVPADVIEGMPQNGNPLLAGISAANQSRGLGLPNDSPYVLLLVRPNGSLPFYSAQRILKTAGVNFGYELVEQDRQVFVGEPANGETEIVRRAVNEAIERRSQLYGGMLVEIQRLKDRRATQPDRQARLMPDGRITVPGERDHQLPGRFFAGGEPPPMIRPQLNGREGSFQPPTTNESSPTEVNPPAETPNPFGVPKDSLAESDGQLFGDAYASNDRPLDRLSQDSPLLGKTNPFADIERSGDQGELTESTDAADDRLQLDELFAGSPSKNEEPIASSEPPSMMDSLIAGSTGDRQPVDNQRLTDASAIPVDNLMEPLVANNSNLPDRIHLDWLNQPPLTSPEAPSMEPGSPMPPDWSESVTAPADEASRTVGAAENQNPFATSEPSSGKSNGQPNAPSEFTATLQANANGAPAPPIFGSNEESALSKFMRSLDDEIEAKRPDPFLVSLLEAANTRHATQVPRSRRPVSITLKESTLIVGNAAAINIDEMTDQQVLMAVLQGLASEMKSAPLADGSVPRPTVDFVSDVSSIRLRSLLQSELKQMDVTTRSASILKSPKVPDGLAVPTWPPFDTDAPKRESATPMESSPSVRTPGGLSI